MEREPANIDRWCRTHLGAGVDRVVFREGHLSTVLGVELTSGREIVVKMRPDAPRLRGCVVVHRRLFEQGFPCPEPLVDLEPLGGGLVASAEAMMSEGDLYPRSGRSPVPFASALARLVGLAPPADEIMTLDPRPPWTAPDFTSSALWPPPDDSDVDLNTVEGPPWLDEAGRTARRTLSESTFPLLVGHADFYTGNLRWRGDELYAVWDWDSTIAAPESTIAGLAAAVYPADKEGSESTVEESAAFLEAYQAARGRFSDAELAHAWAAGLWIRSFDTKKQCATGRGPKSLTETEAMERRRRVEGL